MTSAIDQQIAALEKALAEWDESEAIKAQYGDPTGVQRLMFETGRAHLHTDLRLLRAIRELLSGLPWIDWKVPPVEEEEWEWLR